ncbi:MAG TPA: DUF2721 domain-containing protein [Parvularcula sp.]|nr:DUF2721 domain-containing protein [Parvularcula sp.]HBS30519.1 DUF2721 domain-containing protein [Parvularcula sp.]HBS36449.1 DUF2721 domain-containing protein [Parvularcula sp.]
MENHIDGIGRIIQLSVAPVFLLVAIGSFLNVATQRLARVVDRSRMLKKEVDAEGEGPARAAAIAELNGLSRRISLANYAIYLWSAAALLVAIDVALLFAGALVGAPLYGLVAALFALAMIAVIGGFGFFMAEISVATRTLRIRTDQFLVKAGKD